MHPRAERAPVRWQVVKRDSGEFQDENSAEA